MYHTSDTLASLPPTFTDVLDMPDEDDCFACVARAADMELEAILVEDTDPLAFVEDDLLVLS